MNNALISDWHNLSKFQISEEVATKRNVAFTEILTRNEKSYWVDIVKIFLDFNADEKSITHFVKAFQSNDDSFPRLKIEKLTKALAAMALTAKIQVALMEIAGEASTKQINEEVEEEEEKNEESTDNEQMSNIEIANIISNALMNATFLKQIKIETKIPLVQLAINFIRNYSSEDRTVNLDINETKLIEIEQRMSEEEDGITVEENLLLIQALQAILKSNNIQKEELNILWWIFGEYSEVGGEYFVNIDKKAMSIIAAREIHDLSQFYSELPASKHLLRKILSLSKSDKSGATAFSLKECIETLDTEVRKKIIGNYGAIVGELTPCMNALLKYDENRESKNIKVNIDEKMDLGILSSQFYKELTFLSAI